MRCVSVYKYVYILCTVCLNVHMAHTSMCKCARTVCVLTHVECAGARVRMLNSSAERAGKEESSLLFSSPH
jgi:hypothetical protein